MSNNIKYIPVVALEQELAGCHLAIQCDQGGLYEYERIEAIKNILDWVNSPSYLMRLSCCGFVVPNSKEIFIDYSILSQ